MAGVIARFAAAVGAVAIVLALPAAAHAKAYEFEVKMKVVQESVWDLDFAFPRDCDEGRWIYSGNGYGYLEANVKGGRVTFRGNDLEQPKALKVPGYAINDGEWTGPTPEGNPDECGVQGPVPMNTSDCNPLIERPGELRAFLPIIRGKLFMVGGFYRDQTTFNCPDPTYYTGVVSTKSNQRRDVDDLIRDKRVRSIELSGSRDEIFHVGDFEDPAGANTVALSGSGEGEHRWSIKLVRVR